MFPSSSNSDHFTFTNQAAMLGSSFTENKNPSSSREHHPSPFLNFSDEHFLADDDELFIDQILSQHQILGNSSTPAAEAEIKTASPVKATKKNCMKKNAGNGEMPAAPRKRAGKKDRHSKIYTAQGPRDRRMRLSLPIARKFFDLQDMLGFDKASKTIEWLFSKSKAAIKELTEGLPSVKNSCTSRARSLSSTSESEVASAIKKSEDTEDQKSAVVIGKSLVAKPRGATNRKSRKPIINPVVRDSRDKARARARERTIEKMKMKGLGKSKECSDEANPRDLEQLGSSSPIETAEYFGSCSQEKNSPPKVATEEEDSGVLQLPDYQIDSVSIIEKFLGITTSPRSSSIFDYTHNIGESVVANSQQKNPIYTGNWDNTENEGGQYSYCETTNVKGSTCNLQAQNPGAIFKINPVAQDKKSGPIYTNTGNVPVRNPSSDIKAFSNAHEQNPSSIALTSSNIDSQPHFLGDQFCCNPIVDNKYCHLY